MPRKNLSIFDVLGFKRNGCLRQVLASEQKRGEISDCRFQILRWENIPNLKIFPQRDTRCRKIQKLQIQSAI